MSQCAKLHIAGWTWAVFTRVNFFPMPPHIHIVFVDPLLVVAEVWPTSEFGASKGCSYVAPMR
jgi:hypothetical protein